MVMTISDPKEVAPVYDGVRAETSRRAFRSRQQKLASGVVGAVNR